MIETLPSALARAIALMQDLGLRYALIGGGAIIARVRTRATEDLDLLVSPLPADIDSMLEAASRRGYSFDPAERELFDEGLVRLWGPPGRGEGVGLDLIVADSPYLAEVIERATPVDLGSGAPSCATLEDLVLLKLEAHRAIDIDDVLAIKDTFRDALDMDYIRTAASSLGLLDRVALYFDD